MLLVKSYSRFSRVLLDGSRRRTHQWPSGSSEIYGEKPYQLANGFLKLFVGTFGSLYVGGKLAQHCANFLEENEIFVHADDDDDD